MINIIKTLLNNVHNLLHAFRRLIDMDSLCFISKEKNVVVVAYLVDYSYIIF